MLHSRVLMGLLAALTFACQTASASRPVSQVVKTGNKPSTHLRIWMFDHFGRLNQAPIDGDIEIEMVYELPEANASDRRIIKLTQTPRILEVPEGVERVRWNFKLPDAYVPVNSVITQTRAAAMGLVREVLIVPKATEPPAGHTIRVHTRAAAAFLVKSFETADACRKATAEGIPPLGEDFKPLPSFAVASVEVPKGAQHVLLEIRRRPKEAVGAQLRCLDLTAPRAMHNPVFANVYVPKDPRPESSPKAPKVTLSTITVVPTFPDPPLTRFQVEAVVGVKREEVKLGTTDSHGQLHLRLPENTRLQLRTTGFEQYMPRLRIPGAPVSRTEVEEWDLGIEHQGLPAQVVLLGEAGNSENRGIRAFHVDRTFRAPSRPGIDGTNRLALAVTEDIGVRRVARHFIAEKKAGAQDRITLTTRPKLSRFTGRRVMRIVVVASPPVKAIRIDGANPPEQFDLGGDRAWLFRVENPSPQLVFTVREDGSGQLGRIPYFPPPSDVDAQGLYVFTLNRRK